MNGFVGNRPVTTNGGPSLATPERASGRMDPAGKAGKALIAAMDSYSFDANLFAYYVVSMAKGMMRKRLMSIVFAIIHVLADTYDAGDMDDTTTNAKRFTDTMATYGMEE